MVGAEAFIEGAKFQHHLLLRLRDQRCADTATQYKQERYRLSRMLSWVVALETFQYDLADTAIAFN